MVCLIPPAGRRRLVMAGLVAAVLVPAPAAPDATATLTVRARVVDECRIRLPDVVPPHVRDRLPEHVRELVVHRCHGPVRPHITAGRFPRRLIDRHRPSGVTRHRPDGRNTVLITLTY